MQSSSYFFCGIGGSGMSALADILRAQGCTVVGSDRSFDHGQTPEKFARLSSRGIRLYPQDGSGVSKEMGCLVVSSAIEETIPDIRVARRLNVPVRKRADILAELFSQRRGIAIGGTSGKTTVTGMAGCIFAELVLDPTVVNGGVMQNFKANYRCGNGEWFIAETDESDGSIALFTPDIAVLNNITLDHKPVVELRGLFRDFVTKAKTGAVINMDDPEAALLAMNNQRTLGFGIEHGATALNASALRLTSDGSIFDIEYSPTGEKTSCTLHVPGRHNVSNALASIGTALLAGIGLKDAAAALASFKGTSRRLEWIGEGGGITVIDDFAHNPDKIAASLATLTQSPGRLLIMFQPHGYGPMRMMRKELAEAFVAGLRPDDLLIMPEILYLGGTTKRDISSRDLIEDITVAGRSALFVPTRNDAGEALYENAKPGDRIIVMGARDDTLAEFARQLLARFVSLQDKNELLMEPVGLAGSS